MRPDAPDRTLRAVAAELSELDDGDLQAVLGGLDVSARQRLSALIERYRGGEPIAPGIAAAAPEARLSDWLTDRLSTGSARDRLTARAQAALDAAAADAGWRPSPPPSVAAKRGLRSWLGWGR